MVAAWAWGAYLGERHQARHPRQDQQLHAPPRQHHDDAGQGGEQLHQLHPGQHGSHRRRLRRGPAARRLGLRVRKARARTSSSSRTAWSTPPTSRPAPSTASRATPSSTSAKDLGLPLVESASPRRGLHRDEAFFTGTAAEVTPIRELDRVESASVHAAPSPRRSRLWLAPQPFGRAHCAHWAPGPASAPRTQQPAASGRTLRQPGRLGAAPALGPNTEWRADIGKTVRESPPKTSKAPASSPAPTPRCPSGTTTPRLHRRDAWRRQVPYCGTGTSSRRVRWWADTTRRRPAAFRSQGPRRVSEPPAPRERTPGRLRR